MKNKENIPVIVAEITEELSKLKRLVQKLSKVICVAIFAITE